AEELRLTDAQRGPDLFRAQTAKVLLEQRDDRACHLRDVGAGSAMAASALARSRRSHSSRRTMSRRSSRARMGDACDVIEGRMLDRGDGGFGEVGGKLLERGSEVGHAARVFESACDFNVFVRSAQTH
ncbi:hypothetical protein, partial [Paraburkholderia sp.]|uniref:hypothetical protein n=1 Tax=Paraburkholderia sp. TaxID=1926495 RepID=UPI002F3F579A